MAKFSDIKRYIAEGCKDISKQMLAEFLGTLFLVFLGCGSTVGGILIQPDNAVPILDIALCFGVTVGVIVHITGHVSGGHINPAVTVGMLVAQKMSIIRAIFYVLSQLVGAITGAALLYAVLPSDMRSSPDTNLGVTKITPELNDGQAFEIEFFITFLLVFGVFMIFDPQKSEMRHEPLVIGLIVAVCHIFAIKFTGASMNPARSFGPALIAMHWRKHWVYWVGPILGGVVAAILYKGIFDVSHLPVIDEYQHKIAEDICALENVLEDWEKDPIDSVKDEEKGPMLENKGNQNA